MQTRRGKGDLCGEKRKAPVPPHQDHWQRLHRCWVDAADITKASASIAKGSKVKVNKGAKTYTGGSLASFVYSTVYTVMQIDGDRVVIGKDGVVTAAVNIKNLTLVG